ncbi:MAG: leucyl aminopeptidase family protein [Phycisphaerales bacterium]
MFKGVTLSSSPVSSPAVVVFGVLQGQDIAEVLPRKLAYAADVIAASKRSEFAAGESGKIAEAFPTAEGSPERVIVLGLGKKEKVNGESLRSAFAALARRLAAIKASSAALHVSAALDAAGIKGDAGGRAAGEAFGLLSWNNLTFKGKGTDESRKERPSIVLDADKKALGKGIEFGLRLAESTNMCRSLSETPPNIATPKYIADLAKKLAKDHGLDFMVFEGKDLEKEKLTGHLKVGKASENKPCMIRLVYNPEKVSKKKSKPAVLVGKTMTDDTGGLSLKVNNGMVGMKRDKDGGCAVLGAMHAIATIIKPDRQVIAYLCAAENSLSDEAYRPDDVITYRNGVTVEVTNTDAEGRLVLADALAYTCEKDDPAYIVDLATLTGGVIVALGSTFAGLFCEDDALRARVEAAASTSGERVWRLPMHREYTDMMKSPIADILNSNPNRKAHAGQGAAFLASFVKEGTPWCHLDIAGVHVSESDGGMYAKGSTGWGVRLLADLLADA